jgi:hypothetical protein
MTGGPIIAPSAQENYIKTFLSGFPEEKIIAQSRW